MGIKQKQMIVSQRSPNPPHRSGIRERCGADPEVGARGRRSIEEGSDNGKPDAEEISFICTEHVHKWTFVKLNRV